MAEAGGLFILDGEDAGNTPWEFDSIVEEGTCTIALSAAAKAHGTYGYAVTMEGTNDECYGIKAFASAKTVVYVRFYLYIDSSFQLGQYQSSRIFALRDGTTSLVYIALNKGTTGTGNPTRWTVAGQDLTAANITTNFSVAAWHYIDIYWLAGTGADGGATVLVDGTQIFSELDNNLTAYAADDILVGPNNASSDVPAASSVLYFDDIKAADTGPIGVYVDAGGGASIAAIASFYRRRRS